ncbi:MULTISPECIES: hypothetical protein [unclassified Streptomyces]|uniref:hypothetical protein n=1 Tax=unclassified Streptomyces TaxID=2593676 RepID=UPI000DAF1DED|nr:MULTISPECIES: hypothetical protein [unclassified Streptomyces]PZT71733.1 hypothetical protein DNK55_31835 [Streptomyces sp. AC1-42T]PZT73141.1 hypothetical protein DNK56_33240 [Streptomyces sp. AC1-42W]
MAESWVFDDDRSVSASAAGVAEILRARMAAGRLETWLASSSGRALALVTNTERAMVVLMEGEGDPGEHAVDPGAEGWSDGFVLANGQDDEYPDEDTVPVREAFRLVEHIVATGAWPDDAHWVADR